MANISASKGVNERNKIYNNGKIINKITIRGESSKPADPVTSRPSWFGVPDGIQSFYGREKFLILLHETLQQNKDKGVVTILSQMKVLVGMGGIGKTQTARRYIYQYEQFYENVIWIEAETKSTLKNSFLRLARQLGISTATIPESNWKSTLQSFVGLDKIFGLSATTTTIEESTVDKIYRKLCADEKSTLFVFDNVDDFNSGIEQFLPSNYRPDFKSLAILVTSRIQDWSLRFETVQVLPLDVFTPEESLNFIGQQLNIPGSLDEKIREETREFIEVIGGLPLALQQSVAFIIQQINLRGPRAEFSDYIKQFKSAMAKIHLDDEIPGSPSTIFVTWAVTSTKLKTLEHGETAIKIMEALAFLYADGIPVPCILSIFDQVEQEQILRCLMLLEKYSLIKREFPSRGNPFVTIHRQLQFVLLQNMKNSGNLEKTFDRVIEGCYTFLKTLNPDNFEDNCDTFLSIEHLIENPLSFLPTTDKLMDFIAFLPYVLFVFDEKLHVTELAINVFEKCRDYFGENHEEFKFLHKLRFFDLYEMQVYSDPESLTLLKKVLQRLTNTFGSELGFILELKHKLAEALFDQVKYSESSSLFEHVLEQKKKVFGEHHESTLRTKECLARLFEEQKKWLECLELYQEIETKTAETFRTDPWKTFQVRDDQARMLIKMKRFQEASKLLRDNYEKRTQIDGEDDLETIEALEWLSNTVEKEGKGKELRLKRKVLELYKKKADKFQAFSTNSEIKRLTRIQNKKRFIVQTKNKSTKINKKIFKKYKKR